MDAPIGEDAERLVTFFSGTVPPVHLPVTSNRGDVVVFAATASELWSVARVESGVSRGPGGIIERLTGERVTTRAWRTVVRVLDRLA